MDILKEYGIQNKTVGAVTDSGFNFVKAFNLFGSDADVLSNTENDSEIEYIDVESILTETEEDSMFRLPRHQKCVAHKINLIAVKDVWSALEDASFKKILIAAFAKCQALWNKQHRSTLSSDLIRQLTGGLFIFPVVTRWNSTFHAMGKLHKRCDG